MPKPINYCFQQSSSGDKTILYIYDDIAEYGSFNWSTYEFEESETSAKFFKDQLNEIRDNTTIELHINSNGGSVKEGVAIYNLLKQKNCKKIGIVDGVAHSIAFVILQACDERIMGVGTSALIHDMWISCCGNAKELRKVADDLDVLSESNRQIFMERGNLDEQQLIEMMSAETYLTPDKALEYGLIDEVSKMQKEPDDPADLKEQVIQLKQMLAQQKSFREELKEMQKIKEQKEPGNPQEKLSDRLSKLFEKM